MSELHYTRLDVYVNEALKSSQNNEVERLYTP